MMPVGLVSGRFGRSCFRYSGQPPQRIGLAEAQCLLHPMGNLSQRGLRLPCQAPEFGH